MSLQHIQKNSPGLLPKPAEFEKNPPNGYRVIRKTKCGAGGAAGAGGAGSSPIHKQASLAGRLINWSPRHCHVFSIKWVNTVTYRVVTCLLVLNQKVILWSKEGFSETAIMRDQSQEQVKLFKMSKAMKRKLFQLNENNS